MKSTVLALALGLLALACRTTPSYAEVIVIVIQKDSACNNGGSTPGLIQIPMDLTTNENAIETILPIKSDDEVLPEEDAFASILPIHDNQATPPPFGGFPHYPMYPGFPTGRPQWPEHPHFPQFQQNLGAMPFYGLNPNPQGPPQPPTYFQRPISNFQFQNGPLFSQPTNKMSLFNRNYL